jgi:hypothetical protein
MSKKIVYRAFDLRDKLESLYDNGITRGEYAGFDNLHEYFSVKKGVTTYIFGSPFSGKSEFWLEMLVNLSELYGYRHVLFSPETGKAEDIIAELISKYCRKPFYKQNIGHITEQEMNNAISFIQEYFYVIDPEDKDLELKQFYDIVGEIEKEGKIKIDTTLIDPYNELMNDIGSEGGRQDILIEKQLGIVRKNAQMFNRHNALITHCRDQMAIKKTIDGRDLWYYPPPTAREVSGGQAWFRKAMNLIAVWRPPVGWKDGDWDTPAEDNEVHIIIQKFKPKGTGKRGVVKLFYDIYQNRYYEKTESGTHRYAGSFRPIHREVQASPYQF